MNITVIGTGYVGLVTGTCFAEVGHNVICLDKDIPKINKLKKGIIPIYEPKLDSLVKSNYKDKRLNFTTSYKEAINSSDIIFIAVDTPSKKNGQANLSSIEIVIESIAKYMNSYKIIVQKSTAPVGTCKHINNILTKNLKKYNNSNSFNIVSNPEFLKEGSAVSDFMKPDRIIIGIDNNKLKLTFDEMYKPFNRKLYKIQYMDIKSSELTKYAANALLATKISFINEIANICDLVGANIEYVRQGIGSDKRIGYEFLYPGCGYGGSCFPKDIKALSSLSKKMNYKTRLINSVDDINEAQKKLLFRKIKSYFGSNLKKLTISVWGLSFKPETNDTRYAPSINLITDLLNNGATVLSYDPVASLYNIIPKSKKYKECKKPLSATKNSDALVICTEWKEFWSINLEKLKLSLKNPVIFDGRNIYNPSQMSDHGFKYIGIGTSNL